MPVIQLFWILPHGPSFGPTSIFKTLQLWFLISQLHFPPTIFYFIIYKKNAHAFEVIYLLQLTEKTSLFSYIFYYNIGFLLQTSIYDANFHFTTEK